MVARLIIRQGRKEAVTPYDDHQVAFDLGERDECGDVERGPCDSMFLLTTQLTLIFMSNAFGHGDKNIFIAVRADPMLLHR